MPFLNYDFDCCCEFSSSLAGSAVLLPGKRKYQILRVFKKCFSAIYSSKWCAKVRIFK